MGREVRSLFLSPLSYMIIEVERTSNGISQALKRRRRELGLSLAGLARRVRTSAATISRYENGWNRFQVYTLRKLASALGCRLVMHLEPLRLDTSPPGREAAMKRLRRLFWDKPLRSVHFRQYPDWVIRRVLEVGNLADIRALNNLLGRSEVLRRAAGLRFTSKKTERFWASLAEREGVQCTRKSSPPAAGISWLK